ncbi:MAG TPA: transglutaminase-like domain-containing protein [Luteibacter sp.]|uniref:transglutaminase-like domain-containing protein n=1 Tax=Luteibacter sp. TaxID=1886636 RepID=UPI002F3F3C83
MRTLQAFMVGLLCLASAYAEAQDVWMTVTLDGHKVGKMHVTREVTDSGIATAQVLDVHLNRMGAPALMRANLGAVESPSGAPLGFSSTGGQASAGAEVKATRRDDGVFQLEDTTRGESKITLLQWPDGALLSEGQRLTTVSHGYRAGTTYRLRVFEPSRQQVADVDVTVVGDEWVVLPGGRERLHHLKQVLAGSESTQSSESWVDDAGTVRRSISPLLGFRIEMAACDEACANAPNEHIDILRAAMIDSPRALPAALRTAPIRYLVVVRGDRASPFISTDEQQVTDLGNGQYQIDTSYAQPYVDESRPTRDDTAANAWVQSDAPEVHAMALKVVGNASNNLQRMRRLRAFLTDYIDAKTLDVDYASALETLQSRRGDCTEHAVLLAALARSLHIPTRVVSGLVYVDRYADAERVFIPHMWVQAWLDGHWVSFDSAQGRYDTTHIALAAGDGDPRSFFAAKMTLGSIDILRAVPVPAVMDARTRGLSRPDMARDAVSTLAPPGAGTGH